MERETGYQEEKSKEKNAKKGQQKRKEKVNREK